MQETLRVIDSSGEGAWLGARLDDFGLSSLASLYLGGDAFTAVYFKTSSGNMYRIAYPRRRYGEFVLEDTRQTVSYKLTDADLREGRLQLGQPFRYGSTGRTTPVIEIVCVQTERVYRPGYLDQFPESGAMREWAQRTRK